jgi:peptide/nickel transport system permease protein
MAIWIPESVSPRPAAAGRSFGLAGIGGAIVHEPVALLGLALVVLYVAVALVVGLLPLRDPLQISTQRLVGPTPEFPFGTDALGRDVLSRILFGARLSIRVAAVSVAIATIVGGTLGLIAGYLGAWVDLVIGRVLDVFFAFPAILLALGIVAALGPDPSNIIIAIAVVYTPIFARVVRGPVLAIKAREFVEAARAVGATRSRIVVRHILPNLMSTLVVQISLALSWAVLTEGALSFLGLSAQPPAPSWGVMLSEGRQYLEFATHLAVFPGLAIMIAVLGFNLLGDGLRDALDPQRR